MSQDFEEQWNKAAQNMKAELQAGFREIEASLDEQLQRLQQRLKPDLAATGRTAQTDQTGFYEPLAPGLEQPEPGEKLPPGAAPADIANRLHSAAIHLLRRVRQSDVLTGISPARLSALSVVGFGGPCTISDLASAEQVSLPSISRIVAALEQDGLVQREDDERDGRLVRIAATEKGLRILREGRSHRTAHLNSLLQQMTPAELAATAQTVAALERLLGGPH